VLYIKPYSSITSNPFDIIVPPPTIELTVNCVMDVDTTGITLTIFTNVVKSFLLPYPILPAMFLAYALT
jgi:hypothetical protein